MVKNAKKLGLTQEPIPFSYKGGADGREKQRRAANKWDDLNPSGVNGLYMFNTVQPRDNSINSVNIEEKSNEFLSILHKRLGYTKPEQMTKILNAYENNKRKYTILDEAAQARKTKLDDEENKQKYRMRGASLIFMERAKTKKLLAKREASMMKKLHEERLRKEKETRQTEETLATDSTVTEHNVTRISTIRVSPNTKMQQKSGLQKQKTLKRHSPNPRRQSMPVNAKTTSDYNLNNCNNLNSKQNYGRKKSAINLKESKGNVLQEIYADPIYHPADGQNHSVNIRETTTKQALRLKLPNSHINS